MLTRRVERRKESDFTINAGPVVSVEHSVTQMGWQVAGLFCDGAFLDRLCKMIQSFSGIFEDPDFLYSDAEEQWQRLSYRTSCHQLFLELWGARLRLIMPDHWSHEVPVEYQTCFRSVICQSIACVAQTQAWTSRPLMNCFDLVKFWEIFMDFDEQAFGECLLYTRCAQARLRLDACGCVHKFPSGFFHVDTDSLERHGYKGKYIDTRVLESHEKETGKVLADGQTPPGCPFNVNWICNDIPGVVLAQVYRPSDGLHEIIKHGHLDIKYDVLMKNMWIGFLAMPPHDWSQVIDPRLYPHESFNVRYVKLRMDLPWIVRAAMRMPAEIVFRAERFENKIVFDKRYLKV